MILDAARARQLEQPDEAVEHQQQNGSAIKALQALGRADFIQILTDLGIVALTERCAKSYGRGREREYCAEKLDVQVEAAERLVARMMELAGDSTDLSVFLRERSSQHTQACMEALPAVYQKAVESGYLVDLLLQRAGACVPDERVQHIGERLEKKRKAVAASELSNASYSHAKPIPDNGRKRLGLGTQSLITDSIPRD